MKKVLCIALALVMVLGLAACGGTTQPTETKQPDPTKTPVTEQPSGGTETPTPAEPTVTKADLGIEPLIPDGETILDYSNSDWATVSDLLDILTDEDLENVKSQNLTAVVCMHENASYWSQAFIAGITSVFEKLNIEILSVTDAGFAVESMITNVENAVSLKPDLMIVYVLDSGAMQSCVQSAIDAGIKVVYYEAAVDGTEHGTDYIGTVVADNYTISYTCMRLMIEKGGICAARRRRRRTPALRSSTPSPRAPHPTPAPPSARRSSWLIPTSSVSGAASTSSASRSATARTPSASMSSAPVRT